MKAVDTLDSGLISSAWSHDPEVSFIHPRGTVIGFEHIHDDFYKNTMGLFSHRELILEKPILHIYGDSEWSQMTWTFHATFQNGPQITTTGERRKFITRRMTHGVSSTCTTPAHRIRARSGASNIYGVPRYLARAR